MKRKVIASAVALSLAIILSIGANAYAAQVRKSTSKTPPTMENPDTCSSTGGASGGG